MNLFEPISPRGFAIMFSVLFSALPSHATQLTVQHLHPQMTDVQFEATFEVVDKSGFGSDLAFFHPFAYRNLDADPIFLSGSPQADGMTFRVQMNSSFDFYDTPGNALRLLDLDESFFPFLRLFNIRSDIPGFDATRVSFDANSVTIQFAGLSVTEGQYVALNINTSAQVFNIFTPRAEFWLGPKAHDDSYWVRGYLKLGATSNGINPLSEPVTIKVGTFSHTVPAGSFRQEGTSYVFKGPVGPSTFDIRISRSSNPGGYSFKSCLKNGDFEATTMKPQVQISVGDDQGQATLDVGYAKFGKGADGKKWVFPPAK